MDRIDNRYSRFVATMKVVLLLSALAVLSTLFLVARGPGPADLPFTERDLRALVDTQRIEAPTYRGVTEDGRTVSVSAAAAEPRPEAPDLIDITELSAVVREVGGDEVQLTSDGGMLNNATQLATFLGQVHVTLMDGYILETDTLVADLDGSVATSPDPVRLTGPRLSLTAGSLEVTSRAEAQPLVVFKDGVRLIYTPQSE